MKILLCEDDNNIATISLLSLKEIGRHQVTWVQDGQAAYENAKNGSFDLILLDDMMPKLSGVDVCAKLKSENVSPAPIIFMSANPQEKNVTLYSPLTIGFIAKPFDPMSLNTEINNILAGQKKKAI